MIKKTVIFILFISLFLVTLAPVAQAAEEGALIDVTGMEGYPAAPSVSAEGIILVDAKSGTVLFGKNANTKYYPASITKVLTALIVIENCSLDETVTFSYRATHELEAGSSGIARTEGEQMSVRECLYGMLVASANECAQALAEHVAGSFEAFATMMNEKAAELGCKNSHFTNPSGLNDSEHYTTCYDMALIMREAIKNPEFLEIDSSVTHTIPKTNKHSEELPISMSHELLKGSSKYKWAVCGKTGYTNAAGFTLVTYATKNNMDLICVALHCQSSAERASSSTTAFEYGFNNFTSYDLGEIGADIKAAEGTGQITFLNPNIISLTAASNSAVVLPNNYQVSELTQEMNWNVNSSNEDCIGRVIYKIGGKAVGQAELVVDRDAHNNFAFLRSSTSGEVSAEEEEGNPVLVILIILGVVFLLLIIGGCLLYQYINGKSKRRRKSGVKVDKRLGIK